MSVLETKVITGVNIVDLNEKVNEYIDGRPANVDKVQKDGNARYVTVSILTQHAQEDVSFNEESTSAPITATESISLVPDPQEAQVSEDDELNANDMIQILTTDITTLQLDAGFSSRTGQEVCNALWDTAYPWWSDHRDYRVIAAIDRLTIRADVEFAPVIKEGLILLRGRLIRHAPSGGMKYAPGEIPEGTFKMISKHMPSTGGHPI